MLRYEEEGVSLNPRVVLCESIEKFARALPGGQHYVVGSCVFDESSGKRILKDCAPLARHEWVIFIERKDANELKYGVLSYLATPTSVSLDEMISIDSDIIVILVRKIDDKTIRFSGSRGTTLDMSFSTMREPQSVENIVDKFCESSSKDISDGQFSSYLARLLTRVMTEAHGTILVCTSNGAVNRIPGMQDAVTLEPPLDIAAIFTAYRRAATADAILELQRAESLLSGMLQSDGIVAFDKSGRAIAYRVFFKPDEASIPKRSLLKAFYSSFSKIAKSPPQPGHPPISGGARRRAFEGLKSLVGDSLECALFQSQDGYMEFVRN